MTSSWLNDNIASQFSAWEQTPIEAIVTVLSHVIPEESGRMWSCDKPWVHIPTLDIQRMLRYSYLVSEAPRAVWFASNK